MRRAEPLHPPAFLVDQDRGIGDADCGPEFPNKSRHLGRTLDVALEQNEAPWPLGANEFAFGVVEDQPGYARDECALRHSAD
ncbi:hypothetical protein [Bradyrhizobium sp. BR 1433]|uniref:hypothetical protein n=1 Tax=Bradyrhizobium sp. BR 1433 TaxID=3447967 RepID=UPI003EE7661B